jgi:hypothetical protein
MKKYKEQKRDCKVRAARIMAECHYGNQVTFEGSYNHATHGYEVFVFSNKENISESVKIGLPELIDV